MSEELYNRFVEKLEEKYGSRKKETSKFGDSSFGLIANDLCISKSQFTMLISGKGTEGMYQRSIRNIDQLIEYDQQRLKIEQLKAQTGTSNFVKMASIFCLLLFLSYLLYQFLSPTILPEEKLVETLEIHPLAEYFDGDSKSNYVAPYLPETQVQDYCPCSGYEGVWELAEPYIIPLPSKKPGLYYLAKSSDIRMKCQKGVSSSDKGKILIGFENIFNELWIDKKKTPFSPKYFNQKNKTYTKDFYELNMASNPDFIKVCDVYSCFFDDFEIQDDQIIRNGEPCGRHAKNINQEIADEYEIDVEHILKNTISSMAKIECLPAINHYCNPNDLTEGESIIEYDCMFKISTENLGIGGGYPYVKKYRLVKQNYAQNLLCACEEDKE